MPSAKNAGDHDQPENTVEAESANPSARGQGEDNRIPEKEKNDGDDGDLKSRQSETAEDDMSGIDMPFSQPLMPQFSEVVRFSVIVREPDDLSVVTEEVDSTVQSTEPDKEFGAKENVLTE